MESPQERENHVVNAANSDGLRSKSFYPLFEDDPLGMIAGHDLVIVFSKSLRPPVTYEQKY